MILFASFRWKEAIPRMLLDLVSIHISMFLTLALVHLFYLARSPDPSVLAAELRYYYEHFFLPFSPVFIGVLFSCGVYTAGRGYQTRVKLIFLLRGCAIAMLLLLAANYFLLRTQIVARSVTLLFCVCAAGVLVGGRFLRILIARSNDPEPLRIAEQSPILVVGGAGYIGSLICQQLLDAGHKVHVLDSLIYGSAAIKPLMNHPSFQLIVGDCRNIQSVVSAVKGVGAIIHLAAIVGDPACNQDQKSALEINYAATRMLVEIAKGSGVQRFIFASSCSVYGATEIVADEHSAVGPLSIYGQTKVDSEKAILEACSDNFHPTILRLATVFGLGRRPRFDLVVNLLTARAVNEGVITIFNGEQWRPFIHVRDVAKGFVTVLHAPLQVVNGQIYNLGDSRQNYTLAQVAAEIRQLCPATEVQNVANSDRRNYQVSFAKIRRELGFQSTVSLQEGIMELKEAFESGSIEDYTDSWYNNQKFLKSLGSLASHNQVDTQVMAAFGNPKSADSHLVSAPPAA